MRALFILAIIIVAAAAVGGSVNAGPLAFIVALVALGLLIRFAKPIIIGLFGYHVYRKVTDRQQPPTV